MLIAETDYHDEVEVITAPFRGLALGVFLITVGMSVDLRFVLAHWPALLAALIGVLAVKALVTGSLLRLAGARPGVAAEAGVIMASPSETTLIVLAAAAAAGLIGRETAAFWQIVTAIGLTVTPLLARLGQVAARRVDDEAMAADRRRKTAKPRTVIIGYGRVGRLVAEMLTAHGRPYVAVDSDPDAVSAARSDGAADHLRRSRPARADRPARPRTAPARSILTMDDPVLTRRLTQRVRAAFPDLTIVARARDPAHAAELYKAGATDAVPETLESSLQLSEAVLVDLGMAMGPVIASIHEKRAELRAADHGDGRAGARSRRSAAAG